LKRIVGWRSKQLSHAGSLVLIETCLASIPIYLLYFFKFSKWAINIINSHMVVCMWNDYERHRKIHLANWQLVSMKEFVGLGIPNMRDLNMALLELWVKRFLKGKGKLWHDIIKQKYNRSGINIFCPSHSQPSNL